MKIPLSVLVSFSLLMTMLFLMVELNDLCFETYGAWHYYTKCIDAIEQEGTESEEVESIIENGRGKGYEISITKQEELNQVILEYRVKIPVLSIDAKQQINGYAH